LINTLKAKLEAGTLNFVGREGDPFDLKTEGVAIDIAEYLLGETAAADFIAKKMTISSGYTAQITDEDGVEFDLAGTVTFTVVGAIEAEINALTEEKLKPAFKDFATVINKQSPKTIPPYRLWVEYDIDDLEVTFIFSEEVQKMDPYTGLRTTGLKTAFYSLVDVPEIQGVSVGENGVKFKDEAGNPRSGQGFENELMFFGARLVSADGNIPTTIGEVIGMDQAMDLVCETSSGIAFQLGISFYFEAAADQAAPEGLTGVAPTSAEDNDGKITGTTTDMEYKLALADDSAYEACGDGETTDLAPGIYHVRYAAKPGYNASKAVEVIVSEYEAPVVVAEIDKVEAENGKVTITLKEKPTTAPTAEDFSAIIAINGEEATALTLSDFAIDEDGITITFIFEAVEQTETEQSVVIAVKLGDGEAVPAVAFIVASKEIDKEAAKQKFLDAVTAHNPDSDIYEYSFDGKDLAITFDFTGYEGEDSITPIAVAPDVIAAAGEFLTAIFEKGEAQQIVINMRGKTIPIDSSGNFDIPGLACAVFGVEQPAELISAVDKFLNSEVEADKTVTADFTMTVTNQEDVTFILDNLTVTFTNVTEDAQ
jgi:hypothetical protein